MDKQDFVRPLVSALEKRGITVWFDENALKPGDDLVAKVFEEGIGKADAVALILSPRSLQSAWVQQELSASVVRRLAHDTRLIPILLDGAAAPVSLAHLVHLKASSSEADAIAQRIADVVLGIVPKENQVAEAPLASYMPRIARMEKVDEITLRFICEESLRGDRNPYLSRDTLIAFANETGISSGLFEESLAALEQRYYVEAIHSLGSKFPAAVKPTHFGLGVYLETYDPEYSDKYKSVVAAIINEGHFRDSEIARSLLIPVLLVDHILEDLSRSGDVLISRSNRGLFVRPAATLARRLR